MDTAKGNAAKAKNDPGLKGKGSEHDKAQKGRTSANTAVETAQSELDKIIGRAEKLAEEHEDKAQYRAGRIRDATQRLAPHEPGRLEEFGDWFTENLPDILSFTAGVIGLVALFVATGGVAAAVLLLTAAALSATALTMRLSDSEVLASLKDGFTKGEFDSDFWGNVVSLDGDVLGAIPGVGAVGLGARGAVNALRAGEEAAESGLPPTPLLQVHACLPHPDHKRMAVLTLSTTAVERRVQYRAMLHGIAELTSFESPLDEGRKER
ncbi:hypothetical protein ABZ642_27365 [Streptomyces sp. NPDC007157]|uniref:hypothetical protein n=1 Tax=Streptomyces sp. NPDC007157 TaxID=3154681 RepID=UPI0033C3C0F7